MSQYLSNESPISMSSSNIKSIDQSLYEDQNSYDIPIAIKIHEIIHDNISKEENYILENENYSTEDANNISRNVYYPHQMQSSLRESNQQQLYYNQANAFQHSYDNPYSSRGGYGYRYAGTGTSTYTSAGKKQRDYPLASQFIRNKLLQQQQQQHEQQHDQQLYPLSSPSPTYSQTSTSQNIVYQVCVLELYEY